MQIHSKFPSAYEFNYPAIQKAGFSYVLCKDDKNHIQYSNDLMTDSISVQKNMPNDAISHLWAYF